MKLPRGPQSLSADHFSTPSDPGPSSFQRPSDGYFEGSPNMTSRSEGLLARAKRFAGLGRKGLSDSAKNKLLRISEAADNARGARERSRAIKEQLQEYLGHLKLDISIEEGQLASRSKGDPARDQIEKRLVGLQTDSAIIKADIARQIALQSERGEIFTACTFLSDALSKYVARIADSARLHHIAIEPKMQDGETLADAVERLRRYIRGRRVDLGAVKFAPYPSSESKQRMRAEIEALAERGRPNVFHLIESRDGINWPSQTSQTMTTPIGPNDQAQLMISTTPDALGVMAWIHRDALIARLDKEIESCSTDAEALTDEQRTVKSAAIWADILAYEREEEVLIERMEASGALFLRRQDADPRAVLGLSSDMPEPDVEPI